MCGVPHLSVGCKDVRDLGNLPQACLVTPEARSPLTPLQATSQPFTLGLPVQVLCPSCAGHCPSLGS